MKRIKIHITYDKHMRFMLISSLFLGLLLFGLSFAIKHQNRVQANPAEVTFVPSGGGRHFYLTDTNHNADEVLTACASGYHMASLWEIVDVSNLSYDYDHPNAHTKDDSGFGPPSYWNGWVRTGWSSSSSTTTGTGNCQNWSSRSGSDSGVSVRLSRLWETAPGDIATWDASSFSCNLTGPVWCVGDFYEVFLPIIVNEP